MNKYENILSMLGKILGFGLFALIGISFSITPILVIVFVGSDMLGGMLILLELCLACSVHFVSHGLGLFFWGDRYKTTGYVRDGNSYRWPIETYNYLKRNMITNFIELILCAVFGIAYIVFLCMNMFVTISILGLVFTIITFVIFYLFYKKQNYKLKYEYKENLKEK